MATCYFQKETSPLCVTKAIICNQRPQLITKISVTLPWQEECKQMLGMWELSLLLYLIKINGSDEFQWILRSPRNWWSCHEVGPRQHLPGRCCPPVWVPQLSRPRLTRHCSASMCPRPPGECTLYWIYPPSYCSHININRKSVISVHSYNPTTLPLLKRVTLCRIV